MKWLFLFIISLSFLFNYNKFYGERAINNYEGFDYYSNYNQKCNSLKNIKNNILKQLNIKELHYKENKEIKIAVIDTGVDTTNPLLTNHIWVPSKYKKNKISMGFNTFLENDNVKDTNGHGSHVIGTILSIFPNAKIFPIKYYIEDPVLLKTMKKQKKITVEQAFQNAIKVAIDSGVNIINISGGGYYFNSVEKSIINDAEYNNILIIAAAGNDNYNIDIEKNKYYPAAYENNNIISVMANNGKRKARYSNWGSNVDISTIGGFYSTGTHQNCNLYKQGTSQATSIISAFTGILMTNFPNKNINEIKKLIKKSTINPHKYNLSNIFSGIKFNQILHN